MTGYELEKYLKLIESHVNSSYVIQNIDRVLGLLYLPSYVIERRGDEYYHVKSHYHLSTQYSILLINLSYSNGEILVEFNLDNKKTSYLLKEITLEILVFELNKLLNHIDQFREWSTREIRELKLNRII